MVGDFEKFVGDDEERCLALGLAGRGGEFLLRADQMSDLVVRESERVDEVLLGQFLGRRLRS